MIPIRRQIYCLLSDGMVVDLEDGVAAGQFRLLPAALPSRRGRLEAARYGRRRSRIAPPRSQYDVCFFAAMNPQWVASLGSGE